MINTNLFKDDKGKVSSLRIVMLAIIINALFIMNYQVINSETHTFDFTAIATMITLALTFKVGQKPFENQNKK